MSASVAAWPHPTSTARLKRCPRCGAPTLFGLDGERCASAAAVDVAPVTYLGAVVAHLSGLRVYIRAGALPGREAGDGGHLTLRDDLDLEGPSRYPWHVEHRCQSASPAESTDRRIL